MAFHGDSQNPNQAIAKNGFQRFSCDSVRFFIIPQM